jgi:hypothetical protein
VPLAIVRLVAAFTSNETRHKQCMEVLRLARRDAAHIPSYVSDLPANGRPLKRKAAPSKAKTLNGPTIQSP